jgi:hypothetical protein
MDFSIINSSFHAENLRFISLIFFAFYTDVDWKDSKIVISDVFDVVIFPCTILVEYCITCYEICCCIVSCLCRKFCWFAGSIVDGWAKEAAAAK